MDKEKSPLRKLPEIPWPKGATPEKLSRITELRSKNNSLGGSVSIVILEEIQELTKILIEGPSERLRQLKEADECLPSALEWYVYPAYYFLFTEEYLKTGNIEDIPLMQSLLKECHNLTIQELAKPLNIDPEEFSILLIDVLSTDKNLMRQVEGEDCMVIMANRILESENNVLALAKTDPLQFVNNWTDREISKEPIVDTTTSRVNETLDLGRKRFAELYTATQRESS